MFVEELATVKRSFFELFNDEAAATHWANLEKNLLGDGFDRYAKEAEKQTALEERGYGLWRSADLVARGTYAVGGLLLGTFLVKSPWISFIPETWDLLIAAMFLGAPFVPDVQVWWAKRKYAQALGRIIEDMRAAQEERRLYQPLGLPEAPQRVDELQSSSQASEMTPVTPVTSEEAGKEAEANEQSTPNATRVGQKERGTP